MTVDRVRVKDVLRLERRQVVVDAGRQYQEIGVRSFGRGLFIKDPIVGADLGDKRVFEIHENDLVVSNIFAWEGAVGLAVREHAGLVGSHRFMTWTVTAPDVNARYLLEFFRSAEGVAALSKASPGSAGRNRTLSIKGFEDIQVPLPPLGRQDSIAARLDSLGSLVSDAAHMEFPIDPARMLPRLLGDLVRKEELSLVLLGELCANHQVVVHPGDPLRGAEVFVGLEHVEPHTGRKIGERPIGRETGRKLLFSPGSVTYGYLRPYLNKAWEADRTGLCSVEQFVLKPTAGVTGELLSLILRSDFVWRPAQEATNGLQLPRLGLNKLMGFKVPDLRLVREPKPLLSQAREWTELVVRIGRLRSQRATLRGSLLSAARNEAFAAMV